MHSARKPFLIFPRPSKKFGRIYYVQFRLALADGSLTVPRSTGQTSEGRGRDLGGRTDQEGNPGGSQRGRDPRAELIAFLTDFWAFDKSQYVQGLLNRGKTISRLYCRTMTQMVGKFVEPHFKGRRISSLTADDFDRWMAKLAADGTAARTINLARQSINVPLNDAVRMRRIQWNPLTPVRKYHEDHTERGTLTPKEFSTLLALGTASTHVSAPRSLSGRCADCAWGEIRGLRWADVDTAAGLIRVRHSYVAVDGLRDTAKHGSNRETLLIPTVAETLDAIKSDLPAEPDPEAFVVADGDEPMKAFRIREQGFYAALDRIGITDKVREARGIVFHSLRYLFNTHLRGFIADSALRRLTGHKSEAMTDLYDRGNGLEELATGKAAKPERKSRKRM